MRINIIGAVERLAYVLRRRAEIPPVVARALGELPRTARVLDFGAGTGSVAERVSALTPAQYLLADVDAEALARAPARSDLERVLLQPGERLPFERASLDGAFAVDVLHHVPDAADTLREFARVLAPGAPLAIVEFRAGRPWARVMRAMCLLLGKRRHMLAPKTLRHLLETAGFEAELTTLDSLRYLALARRRGKGSGRGG